jgi:hypothetical protein
MNCLFTLTAVIEAPTGLALIAMPSPVGRLLLGAEFFGVAGIALFALGIACWLARDDTQSRAARGLVAAMLLYNVATVARPHFRRCRPRTARHVFVAGSDSPRGDGSLVYRLPAAQSPECDGLIRALLRTT